MTLEQIRDEYLRGECGSHHAIDALVEHCG